MLTVLSVSDAKQKIMSSVQLRLAGEKVPLQQALGRVLIRPVISEENLPPFSRATMDGFAVKAADTFGSSEAMPALLEVKGEVLMGHKPPGDLGPGQAMRISTGGMLPAGSDAVVMVEFTEMLDNNTAAVFSAAAPGENIISAGEDLAKGSEVFPAGYRLRPQDIGLLSALGCSMPEVSKKPRVAIISTGDELVPCDSFPAHGKIRDVNSILLAALTEKAGAEAVSFGIVPDRAGALREALERASDYDCILLSGGSSAGEKDFAASAIDALGSPGVIFHGVSMRPGKPLIFGISDGKPYFGLSGNPTSSMVGFLLFVKPLLGLLEGSYVQELFLPARASVSISSSSGREDYFRAILSSAGEELWAEPVFGHSGLISTVVRGNALLRIPKEKEGVEAGEKVEVMLI